MGGNNEFFCNECAKKKTAKKRISFQELPNVQVFILKRFQYNFQTNSKLKLGNRIEFPSSLNMSKYYFLPDKEELMAQDYFLY